MKVWKLGAGLLLLGITIPAQAQNVTMRKNATVNNNVVIQADSGGNITPEMVSLLETFIQIQEIKKKEREPSHELQEAADLIWAAIMEQVGTQFKPELDLDISPESGSNSVTGGVSGDGTYERSLTHPIPFSPYELVPQFNDSGDVDFGLSIQNILNDGSLDSVQGLVARSQIHRTRRLIPYRHRPIHRHRRHPRNIQYRGGPVQKTGNNLTKPNTSGGANSPLDMLDDRFMRRR